MRHIQAIYSRLPPPTLACFPTFIRSLECSVLKLMLPPVDFAFGSTPEIQEPCVPWQYRSRPCQPHPLPRQDTTRTSTALAPHVYTALAPHIYASLAPRDYKALAPHVYAALAPQDFRLDFFHPWISSLESIGGSRLRHNARRRSQHPSSGTCFSNDNLLLPTQGSD